MKIKTVLHDIFFMFVLVVLPVQQADAECENKNIVVLGDSLVAGYGLPPGTAFPEQLAINLQKSGYMIGVTNAGVSGDTTSGGLSRLHWSVGDDANIVILELGANDALRGIPVEVTRKNLDAMIRKLKTLGVEVILAGMFAPPNMGSKYEDAFNAIYPELAKAHEITFYPFFLDGVATEPKLNLEDGIHPNQEGVQIIVDRFVPSVEGVLESVCR